MKPELPSSTIKRPVLWQNLWKVGKQKMKSFDDKLNKVKLNKPTNFELEKGSVSLTFIQPKVLSSLYETCSLGKKTNVSLITKT